MSLFRSPFGLPVRFESESGKHIENEFLFGLYEYVFTNRLPLRSSHPLSWFYSQIVYFGFPNHTHPSVPEGEISHDQLTAYVAFAELFHLKGIEEINDNIKGLKYKALGQERSLHPRDLIFYRLLNRNYLYLLALPLYYFFAAFSMLIGYRVVKYDHDRPQDVKRIGKYVIQKKLSGELLWVLRCYCVKHSFLLNLVHMPVKLIVKLGAALRFGDVQGMVKSYFQDRDDHPVVFNYNFKF